jgi:hypothetical protein
MRCSHHAGEGFSLQGNVIHITAPFCHREGCSPVANSAEADMIAPRRVPRSLKLAKNFA